jgi:hypothetical protein
MRLSIPSDSPCHRRCCPGTKAARSHKTPPFAIIRSAPKLIKNCSVRQVGWSLPTSKFLMARRKPAFNPPWGDNNANSAREAFVVGLRNAHAMEVQVRELTERRSERIKNAFEH